MMRWIVAESLRSARAVVAAALVLMVFGVWQLRSAAVDSLPEFSPPTVQVQTEALGLSAEEVEQLITVPLEQDLLAGVAWLDTIRSKSVPGLSSVELVFEPGTDLYRARQVVQERISQAAGLPNVSRPPQMIQPQSSTARTSMISLSSKKLTPLEIGVLARWTIRPRLLAVPGVSNVAIWGQRERQLQVQVDPQKLAETNVTLEQVVKSAGNALWVSPLTFLEASTPGTGGFIDTPNQRLGIQHNLPIITPRDLATVSIDETSPPRTLGDVATVVEDHQPLIGDAVVTGADAGRAGFMVVVEKLPGANTSDVTRGVEEALAELRPGLVGLHMDSTIFRPATYVDESLDNLTRWVVAGAVLLVLALFLLFFSWRAMLTALVAIVLSFTVAALVIRLFGETFNVVVFAGLVMALAAVVNDGVSTVDHVTRRLREQVGSGEGGPTALTIIRSAALESGHTVVWAVVIFALALTPIFLMGGLSGDSFFPPLAAACLVALLGSMVVAVTVTPALSLLLLSNGSRRRESPVTGWLQQRHQRILAPFVRTPVPALVTVAVVAVALAVVVPRFDKSLLPTLKDRNLMVKWDAPFGTSLREMDRITARASAELRRVPGVRDVGAQVGQALLGDQAVGADSAEMWVSVDPSADYDRTVAVVESVVAGYPGMRHQVLTYSSDRMREVLGRTSDEVTLRIFGADLDVLHRKADEVRGLLARIDGVQGARVTSRAAEPTMQVEVDLGKAQAAGIKPGDVRRAAATLLSGLRVGNLFEDQKVFDVVVWGTPETRRGLSGVRDMLIDTPTGNFLRLGDVADVRVRPTIPSIEHEGISRFVDVTSDVNGRLASDVEGDLKDRLERVAFPLEYHAEFVGTYSEEQDAQRRLLGFAIAAAIGVFLLLEAAFRSWRLAILNFVLLPVALAGGALAAWVDGGPMTIATVAGLLAVLAVTVRFNVMLVHRFQQLRATDVPFGPELVDRVVGERFAPTVTTAIVTAIVLVPAIALGDVAGMEIVHPMAVVMLGGLVTSTLVTLFVLPALYLRFGPRREPEPLELEIDLAQAERRLAETATAGGGAG